MNVQKHFSKETIFRIGEGGFEEVVESVYGHRIQLATEEEELYNSVIKFDNVDGNVNDEAELTTFKEHGVYEEDGMTCKSEGCYPGTENLLNDLCRQGLIESGNYVIKSDS